MVSWKCRGGSGVQDIVSTGREVRQRQTLTDSGEGEKQREEKTEKTKKKKEKTALVRS